MAAQHPGISWTTLIGALGLAFVVGGAGWTLFQDKFSQAEKADLQIRDDIKAIRAELLQRRHEFVTVEQFEQFEKRFNTVEQRLNTIEQTRPTTGELRAVAEGTKDTISKIEERVRNLENAPRFPRPGPQ